MARRIRLRRARPLGAGLFEGVNGQVLADLRRQAKENDKKEEVRRTEPRRAKQRARFAEDQGKIEALGAEQKLDLRDPETFRLCEMELGL